MFTALIRRVTTTLAISFAFCSSLAFASHYEGGTGMKDGKWTAVLYYYEHDLDAAPTSAETVGEGYETEREAKRAARKAARKANGVIGTDCPENALC